jgi:glucose-1-phosphate cytidylyltransferase
MKVVLFCGGLGIRLREYSDSLPKPMVTIGYRPILWHVMRYYAHYGHHDFVLCLGWKGNVIKDYFLNYDECLSNDFVMSAGGNQIRLLNSDIQDWSITFVDTGSTASIGQRLKAVQPYLADEPHFLANYADGLTDFHLPTLIDHHRRRRSAATFLSVRPTQSFHVVTTDEDGGVRDVRAVATSDVWMNGGYFVLSNEVFDVMRDGEELVDEPFRRLISQGRLHTLKYEGYWGCMDTFKEKQELDERYERGNAPWEVWKQVANERRAPGLQGQDCQAWLDLTVGNQPISGEG